MEEKKLSTEKAAPGQITGLAKKCCPLIELVFFVFVFSNI